MLLENKFFLGWEENIVGKGENAGGQHFLLLPQFFQKASFQGSLKSGLCGKESIEIVWLRINKTRHVFVR